MYHNERRYQAAIQRNIRMNATKTRREKWFSENSDAQELNDWLYGIGKYSDTYVAKHPEGQELIEKFYEDFLDSNTDPDIIAKFMAEWGAVYGVHPSRKVIVHSQFLNKMVHSLTEWGGLTPKQTEMVRKSYQDGQNWKETMLARQKAFREHAEKSEHVGELKQRREFVLTVKKVLSFDNQYSPYSGALTFINIMEDEDNNIFVAKGVRRFGNRGDTVRVKATIVGHEWRDGIAQTCINRPKFLSEDSKDNG